MIPPADQSHALATQATLNPPMNGLVNELLAFMAQADAGEQAFNNLALKLFAHQFEFNAPFQRFCRQRARTPRTVRRWQDIPAVPIAAFKEQTLSCWPPEQCESVFMTSGTTRGDVRGRHFHPHLQVYDTSMRLHFQQRFMRAAFSQPACQPLQSICMGVVFPDESLMPNSSLAHYLQLALHTFGAPGSRCLVSATGLQMDDLVASLQDAVASDQPYALLGASYSLVHVMDALQERGLRFVLPEGSRILDTGGFKGQSREVPMQAFYEQLTHFLGVPASHCINMYGMTELSTQFYDAGNAQLPSLKSGPHWIRSRVVDPLTSLDMPAGERGILVHCDLGNFNSVTTILTEDVGLAQMGPDGEPAGFYLLGRAQGSQAKGCSMAVDEFLRATQS